MSSLNIRRPAQHDLVYGRAPAREFLSFLGPIHGTVVDIGSGEGGWADLLRAAGARRIVAVEPDPTAAQAARARYDEVIEHPIEDVAGDVATAADLIVAADTLEHLFDPWDILRRLHAGARPGTQIAVSVPNLRYIGILAPAILRGRFEYSDRGGIMDRGHLRWFTQHSLGLALRDAEWSPVRSSGAIGSGRRALLNRASGRRLTGLLAHQIYVVAARSGL